MRKPVPQTPVRVRKTGGEAQVGQALPDEIRQLLVIEAVSNSRQERKMPGGVLRS
jgi:hypothetical protein